MSGTTGAGPTRSGALRRGGAVVLLVALAAVGATRAVRSTETPLPLDAHGERTWKAWADRSPAAEARLAEIAPELPPGACVRLVVPRREHSRWWLTKALYLLPEQRVVEVRRFREASAGGRRVRGDRALAAARPLAPAAGAGGMIAPLAAAALLAALGWPSVRRLRPAWGLGATAAVAAVVALAAVVVVGFAAALAGAPPALALLAGAAAAAALGLLAERDEPVGTPEPLPEPPWLRAASALVLLLGAGVFLGKLVRAPLWSWDHYAIWGVKARRLLADGALDLGFLAWPEAAASRPDHPLGVPLAWLTLTFGRRPEPDDFVLLHALAGLALLLVLRGAARAAAGGSWTWGNLLAAALAASPLYWDTEALGLAEMPLALWATAGAALLLAREGGRRTAVAGGLALGFLPWVKTEGYPLAMLFLAAAIASCRSDAGDRRRRWAPAAAACAVLGLAAWGVRRFVLPPGAGFFLGDWWQRGVERLAFLPEIAGYALEQLLLADWLCFWPLLALATLAALALRRRPAAALTAAVWLQLGLYVATALFTYLEPIGHLRAAFFRIAAALVAPGLLAIAHLLAPAPGSQSSRAAATTRRADREVPR